MRRTQRLLSLLHFQILIALILTACNAQVTSKPISGAQMADANRLYEEGRFAEAAALYQTLVDAGAEEGRLYYNLGDAHFKAGDLGRAILNFRRAQRLLPRDGDVASNLKLARAQALDRIEDESEGAIVDLVRRLIRWTTLDEAATAALTLWILLCALGIGAILWRERRRVLLYVVGGVATLLFLSVLSIGIRLLDEHSQPPAVVVADTVPIRSGPGDDYLIEFTLHSGAEVRIVESRGNWLRIALPGDLQGWAPNEALIELSSKD